jgi:hypothetical protein
LCVEPEIGQIAENGAESPENNSVWLVSHIERVGFQRASGRR